MHARLHVICSCVAASQWMRALVQNPPRIQEDKLLRYLLGGVCQRFICDCLLEDLLLYFYYICMY